MSGGSYDYICYKEPEDLLEYDSTIQEMADDLAKLGYANDAAADTQDLLLELRAFKNRIRARQQRLEGVWRAKEWWRSGDSGEDDFKKALESYRGN